MVALAATQQWILCSRLVQNKSEETKRERRFLWWAGAEEEKAKKACVVVQNSAKTHVPLPSAWAFVFPCSERNPTVLLPKPLPQQLKTANYFPRFQVLNSEMYLGLGQSRVRGLGSKTLEEKPANYLLSTKRCRWSTRCRVEYLIRRTNIKPNY